MFLIKKMLFTATIKTESDSPGKIQKNIFFVRKMTKIHQYVCNEVQMVPELTK